jgi:hypothetical protein
MSILAMMIQADGLTLREVIWDIPHDASAMVVYAIIAVFVGFIWLGSRGGTTDAATGGASGARRQPPAAGDRG